MSACSACSVCGTRWVAAVIIDERDAVTERIAQPLPARAIVSSDGDGALHPVVCEERSERPADNVSGVDSQVVANDTADVVLAKNSGGKRHSTLNMRRVRGGGPVSLPARWCGAG